MEQPNSPSAPTPAELTERALRGHGTQHIAAIDDHARVALETENAARTEAGVLRAELEATLSPDQLALLTRYVGARDRMTGASGERRGLKLATPAITALKQAMVREHVRNHDLAETNRRLNDEIFSTRARIREGERWKR